MNPSPIYLDNNATTALDPLARAAMAPFLDSSYANPSSPYGFARAASRALALAREQVAGLLAADPARVVFTSGGTESNNMALHAARVARPERPRLVLSAVEHASVRVPARRWAEQGGRVSVIPVSREGALDLAALRAALDSDVALVSLMTANNETGVCYPVDDVCAWAHAVGAWFHTDAVQAAGKLSVAVGRADFLSVCAHKMHGPKGSGALVVPAGSDAHPLVSGGEQEFGWRAGTENVAAVVGFGVAADIAKQSRAETELRLRAWRDEVELRIRDALPDVWVVGAEQPRLPNTSLFIFGGVETESLLARLDLEGFCCSSGSACAAGAHEPSAVLRAQGWDGAGAVVRVSSSRFTQRADLECLVDCLINSVKGLRASARR